MAVHRYTKEEKERIKRNPLNRGSCSYLPNVVYRLEMILRAAENTKAFTTKEREAKIKAVSAARDEYEQKLEILNTYKEVFPEEFKQFNVLEEWRNLNP